MLIIEPHGGLANRMRALDGARPLAEATGQRVVVVWRVAPDLGVSFADIFEPLTGIDAWHEFDTRTAAGRAAYARFLEEAHIDRTIEPTEVGPLLDGGFRFAALDPDRVTHIKTWIRIHPTETEYAAFRPKPALQQRIDAIAAGFGKTIGVHIRRTDSAQSVAHSPTIAFVRRMREALERGEADNFFVASDDPDEEQTLLAAFPGRIIRQSKRTFDRSTSEAIADAVVDLYCLAATKRLFGSYYSSFSEAAATIGAIPRDTVRLPQPARTRPDPVLTFGIAVNTVNDPVERRFRARMLSATLAAIYAQTDGAFRIILAGSYLPEIDIPVDDRLDFVRVTARPARNLAEAYADGGRKAHAIAMRHAELGGGHLMIMDMDDLVSNRLVEFVRANPDPNGYVIDHGHVWDVRSNKYLTVDEFHKKCGSSSILHIAPGDVGGADSRFSTIRRTGHYMAVENSIAAGRPLKPVPFAGAVWVHNHGGNQGYRRKDNDGLLRIMRDVNRDGVAATPLTAEFALPAHYPVLDDYIAAAGRRIPSLSVAIVTRGRPEGLRRLLGSLAAQTGDRRGREIVVVNDGSHDEAYEAVRAEFADHIKYRALPENVGVAKARNASAELAGGDYLVFTDDDCEPPDWWLDWLQARLQWAPDLDVVCGPTIALPPARPTFFSDVQAGHGLLPGPSRSAGGTLFATANVAIRRALFWKVGGFGFPGPFHGASEDTELSMRLHRAGAAVSLDPSWFVRHETGTRFLAVCRRYWRYGYANGMLSGLTTAPEANDGSVGQRRRDHLRVWAREYRKQRPHAATVSRHRAVQVASTVLATLVRMAYHDGWAKALDERDRRRFA